MRKPRELERDVGWIEVSIYRRIHNGRPAIIVSADPPRNILRVREKAVDPCRRGGVPAGQPAITGRSSRLCSFRPDPGRSRRRTDPTHSASASGSSRRAPRRGGTHRLHRAVAAADDEIVPIEIEQLDGERIERQVVTVEPAGLGRRWTKEVWMGRASILAETEPGTCTSVKSGAVGKELADRVEHLLAAPHPGQPVVDERHLQPGMRGHPASTSS